MLRLDGSQGEGGGQVLRSSLTLSLLTGQPFRIEKIRARRTKPGLMRQHLAAVEAAAQVSGSQTEGAVVGSTELTFRPGRVVPGDYHFAVGTAGSSTLVFQTVLPPLLLAGAPSVLTLEGGTHNPMAPPFDFLALAFLPLVNRLGPRVEVELERPGFYPAGGGRWTARIEPALRLAGFEILERGPIRRRLGRVLLSALPVRVGERMVHKLRQETGWPEDAFRIETVAAPRGPGGAALLEVESEALTEVFAGFAERTRPAEAVAAQAVAEYRRWLQAGVPVGEHLADQLLLPLALAGSGAFATLPLTLHASTQIEMIQRFLSVPLRAEPVEGGRVEVRVG